MQSADILRNAHLSNPATGMPSLALAHSEEISTASSGVSLLHKALIFCAMLIFGTPLLEHHMPGYPHCKYKHHCRDTNCHDKPPLQVQAPLQVHLFLLRRALKRSALPVAG